MRWLALLAGVCFALPCTAHEPSQAYLTLAFEGTELAGRWDVSLADLEEAIGLDRDGDRRITWTELQSQGDRLFANASTWLTLSHGGELCEIDFDQRELASHGNVNFAVLRISGSCPKVGHSLTLDYRLLEGIDPTHRVLIQSETDSGVTNLTVVHTGSTIQIDPFQASIWNQLASFVTQGALHIWEGYDHLVFLALLVLPAVLGSRRYLGLAAAAWPITKIVTAFTLAHSLTLGLATFGLVSPPTQLVESVIAASIIVAALMNLWPRAAAIGPSLAFGFGLVHGLGFATALSGLGGRPGNQLLSLAGFNLGVELGQLAVLLVGLPALIAVGRFARLRRPALAISSLCLGGLGVTWLIERL